MKFIKSFAAIVIAFVLVAGASSCKGGSAFKVGDHVAAKWTNNNYYLGSITAVNADKYSILYDDGDKLDVPVTDLKTLCNQSDLKVGDKVMASWNSSVMLYPGTVTELQSGGAMVKWDDGSEPSLSPYGKLTK
ncbi:MAG TPA: hypothetical protein VFU15_06590 [Bacteroidia bacterium]|nr:hypothetical protein [Bacteroidia bacterium]